MGGARSSSGVDNRALEAASRRSRGVGARFFISHVGRAAPLTCADDAHEDSSRRARARCRRAASRSPRLDDKRACFRRAAAVLGVAPRVACKRPPTTRLFTSVDASSRLFVRHAHSEASPLIGALLAIMVNEEKRRRATKPSMAALVAATAAISDCRLERNLRILTAYFWLL